MLRRRRLLEIHEQTWCPAGVRDGADGLFEQQAGFRNGRKQSSPAAFAGDGVKVVVVVIRKQRELKPALPAGLSVARSRIASESRQHRLNVIVKVDSHGLSPADGTAQGQDHQSHTSGNERPAGTNAEE